MILQSTVVENKAYFTLKKLGVYCVLLRLKDINLLADRPTDRQTNGRSNRPTERPTELEFKSIGLCAKYVYISF